MKVTTSLYAFLIAATFFIGCKEEKLMFDEAPAIYFFKSGIPNPDSVNYSFGIRPTQFTKDTIYLTMRIVGNAMNRDRVIKLDLLPGSTAKPGYHYVMGPLVMPANQFQTRIPVFLYRKPGLKDSIIKASFRVVASDDFKPGYSDIEPGQVKTKLDYSILINDQILKPANWDGVLKPYFGEFSVVKFTFMIEHTGKTIWTGVIGPGDMAFYVGQVKLALFNYEKANGPMLDEKGQVVVMP